MPVGEWCKVLIVDDEVLIRQGVKHYINWEQEGFQIVGEASNGKEAIELIELLNPHIVITDIVMPVMDGMELTAFIKSHYPEIEVIVLSSFGDFDYVRSTFQHGVADYILKPKLEGPELLKALQKVAKNLPFFSQMEKTSDLHPSIEQLIEKSISGFESEYDPAIVKDAFPHSHYCLLGIDLKGGQDHVNLMNLKENVTAAIKTQLSHASSRSFQSEDLEIAFLLNFNISHQFDLQQFVNNMSKSIAAPEQEIGWILSKSFTSFSDLKNVYQENLLKVMQYRFYLPDASVLISDQLPSMPKGKESFNLKQFTEAFKRKRFDDAFQYLGEHVDYLACQYTTDVFEFKSFLGNIVFNITVLLGNMDYDNETLEGSKYGSFASINDAANAEKAIAHLDSFLLEAKAIISSKSNEISDPNMRMLLDYIEQHYAEPLTLTEMAKRFHFNPSYLSTYFSKHNNEGFSEYLNRIRIEKSMELLDEGEVLISAISGMVGYSDHSYFCKVFKKLTGMSPSSYRKTNT